MRRPRLGILLLAAVLAVSFGFHAWFAAHPSSGYQSADERSYGRLAIALAEDGSYSGGERPLHWPPGAPAFFGVAHLLFGSAESATSYDLPAAYWFQAVLALGTALAAGALALALAGRRAGLVGTALVALYPPLILATGEQLSEPLGAFFLVAGFAALAWAARRRRTPLYALAGVLLGLSVLARADLILVPFLTAALCVAWPHGKRTREPGTGAIEPSRRGRGRRHLAAGALVAGGALLVIAPWATYASLRADAFVPVTTGGGSALFVGTYLPGGGTTVGLKRALGAEAKRRNPKLRGIPDFDLEARSVLAVIAARHPELSFEAALQREGRANLRRYATGEPLAFARMMLNKGLIRMWSRYSRGGARPTSWQIRVWHILLVLGATAGLVAGLVRRPNVVLAAVLAAALCSTAIHMIVVSQARYNLPLMPSLLAAGTAGWFLFGTARRSPAPAPT